MEFETAFTMDTSGIKYGPGVTSEVGFDMQQFGAKRVMVVTDPNLADSEPVAITCAALREAGLDAVLFDQVRVEPTDVSFKEAIAFATAGHEAQAPGADPAWGVRAPQVEAGEPQAGCQATEAGFRLGVAEGPLRSRVGGGLRQDPRGGGAEHRHRLRRRLGGTRPPPVQRAGRVPPGNGHVVPPGEPSLLPAGCR